MESGNLGRRKKEKKTSTFLVLFSTHANFSGVYQSIGATSGSLPSRRSLPSPPSSSFLRVSAFEGDGTSPAPSGAGRGGLRSPRGRVSCAAGCPAAEPPGTEGRAGEKLRERGSESFVGDPRSVSERLGRARPAGSLRGFPAYPRLLRVPGRSSSLLPGTRRTIAGFLRGTALFLIRAVRTRRRPAETADPGSNCRWARSRAAPFPRGSRVAAPVPQPPSASGGLRLYHLQRGAGAGRVPPARAAGGRRGGSPQQRGGGSP